MADTKYLGTLTPICDPSIDIEQRLYLAKQAERRGLSAWVIAFDKAVHAPGGTPEDRYKYAFLPPSGLSEAAKKGLLADGASRQVMVGVDRLNRGLIAFDCTPSAG